MKTYLQLVNAILPRMREATVSSVSDTTYSALVGQMVNQVKSEIEGAYYWNALRDTYAVSTVASTTSYAFTGAGPRAAVVGNGWDTTSPGRIWRRTNKEFDEWYFGSTSGNIPSGPPTAFVPAGVSADYDLKIDIYPIPDAVYVMKFNVYVPQDDLSNDADVTRVPQEVLIEEVVARLMVERGDDSAPKPMPGETFILKDLLQTAVSRESGQDDGEMTWEPE